MHKSCLTSANLFDKENPLLLVLSEGTRNVLNAPGNDWNLDLSIPSVRIWKKNRNEFLYAERPKFQSSYTTRVKEVCGMDPESLPLPNDQRPQ